MALAHCGVTGRIQDVDTEQSAEAENCRLFFDHCREMVLEMQPWRFAERRATLQNLGSPPAEWGYRYKYPNFCARVNEIVNPVSRTPSLSSQIAFKEEDGGETDYGRVILTDQEDAEILYNHKDIGVELFSALAVQALSLFLGAHIAAPLKVKRDLAVALEQRMILWLNEAGVQNLEASHPDKEPQASFVSARS